MTSIAYTLEQKLAAVEREIRYRKHVYPRQVEARKMSQRFAEQQVAVFEAIAEDYRQAVDADDGGGGSNNDEIIPAARE